jgi:hypothetical protein
MARKAYDITTIPKNAQSTRAPKRGRSSPKRNFDEDLLCPNCQKLVVNHPAVCSNWTTTYQYDSDLDHEVPVTELDVMVYRGKLLLAVFEPETVWKSASKSGNRQ